MPELEVYSMIGTEGFTRLVAAFYSQIPKDELLSHMYPPQDLEGAEQRLRDFLIYRFGGPQSYIEQRGHPRLRARHSSFLIDQPARDRWMQLMSNALAKAELPVEAERILRNFFDAMATSLMNRVEAEIPKFVERPASDVALAGPSCLRTLSLGGRLYFRNPSTQRGV